MNLDAADERTITAAPFRSMTGRRDGVDRRILHYYSTTHLANSNGEKDEYYINTSREILTPQTRASQRSNTILPTIIMVRERSGDVVADSMS
jgi:hypothetical protein